MADTENQARSLADLVKPLLDSVTAGDAKRAAAFLRELPGPLEKLLPTEWIEANAAALERSDFEPLSPRFGRREFVGPDGHFLIVGPYIARRSSGDVTKLSVLFAEVMPHESTPNLAETLEAMQAAKLREHVSVAYPVRPLAAAGNLDTTVIYMVPDGWGWTDSSLGPHFYDLGGERALWELQGKRAIRRVFDAATAECILAPLESDRGPKIQYRAFEFHDACHATGLGIRRKNSEALMPGYWYRGVEEFRADGLAFELAARLLPVEEAAADIGWNFCLRFGHFLPYSPGPDGPTEHTSTQLLMLDRLLRDGHVVARDDRLGLRDPTPAGFVRATEAQRYEAGALTRSELALAEPNAVMRLYGTISLHQASIVVYQGMMHAPTRGLVS